MSAKGKKSRKRFSDYEVRLADGSYRLLFGVRLRRMADGGHVFNDKKGVRASYGPGQVASAERWDPEPRTLVPADEPSEAAAAQ